MQPPREGESRIIFIALSLALATPAFSQTDAELFDGAFRDAQMAVGAQTALALSRGAARLAAADPATAALIRTRQDAGDAIARAEAAEAAARAMPDGDAAAAMALLARARTAFAVADSALRQRAPAYVRAIGIAPVDVATARALLQPDEAIMLIQPAEDATYIFALTAAGQGWHRALMNDAAVADDVARLRATLDPGGVVRGGEDAAADPGRRRAAGFDRATAARLYRQLWAPLAPLIGNARIVYVVAGGALGRLPLSVLVTSPPTGRDDDPVAWRRTGWLVRRHALVTLPAIGSLRALRTMPRRGRTAGFAGFGDPSLPAGGLPALPGSAGELRALAAALGDRAPTILLGADATEAAVRGAPLDGRQVIAFATHGLVAGEAGREPALAFTPPARPVEDDDGFLTASEVAGLRLSADWVILSACNSAAGDRMGGVGGGGGEALSGLARGFFAAGARAVLVSHWRLRDDGAALLTTATLAAWRRDPAAGHAAALRMAMLAMIRDRTHPERADPARWAPFVVAGEGR